MRLAQYVLLGIGGVRALERDGHRARASCTSTRATPAFAALELAARDSAAALDDALDAARSAPSSPPTRRSRPATTPTRPSRSREALGALAGELGIDAEAIVRLGRTHPDDDAEPFGVTQFALRTSRAANGVSRRHGEVAREMWHAAVARPRRSTTCRSRHVTNGVHLPTWLGAADARAARPPPRRGLARRAPTDPATWAPVDDIPDARAVGRAPRSSAPS